MGDTEDAASTLSSSGAGLHVTLESLWKEAQGGVT